MPEKVRELPPLLPGQAVPPAYDEAQVREDEKQRRQDQGLLLRDEYDPDRPWRTLGVVLNPNSKTAALLEGIPTPLDAHTVLLMAIYEQLAGGQVVDEKAQEKRRRADRARAEEDEPEVTGPVAGGSPEGSGSRTPTTGPSATGGTTTTEDEDAEAAAGQAPEQRERARRAAREQERKK